MTLTPSNITNKSSIYDSLFLFLNSAERYLDTKKLPTEQIVKK